MSSASLRAWRSASDSSSSQTKSPDALSFSLGSAISSSSAGGAASAAGCDRLGFRLRVVFGFVDYLDVVLDSCFQVIELQIRVVDLDVVTGFGLLEFEVGVHLLDVDSDVDLLRRRRLLRPAA